MLAPLLPVGQQPALLQQPDSLRPGRQRCALVRVQPDFFGKTAAGLHRLQMRLAAHKVVHILLAGPQRHGVVGGPDAMLPKFLAGRALQRLHHPESPPRKRKKGEGAFQLDRGDGDDHGKWLNRSHAYKIAGLDIPRQFQPKLHQC